MNIEISVKVACAKSGKTQNDLAAHLKITGVWLRRMMKDNSPRYISKMSDFFGITVSEFIKHGESDK